MTMQAEALDRLIAAVEAGHYETQETACPLFHERGLCCDVDNAYTGSLDAAKALHDALLPGCFSGLSQNIHSGQWYAWVQDKSTWHYDAKNREPARAWLQAILRAYRGTLV